MCLRLSLHEVNNVFYPSPRLVSCSAGWQKTGNRATFTELKLHNDVVEQNQLTWAQSFNLCPSARALITGEQLSDLTAHHCPSGLPLGGHWGISAQILSGWVPPSLSSPRLSSNLAAQGSRLRG